MWVVGRSGRRRDSNQSREAEIIRNRRQRAASVLQLLHRGEEEVEVEEEVDRPAHILQMHSMM